MQDSEIRFQYVLHLADNSMILGQRNAEWCGHGPVLEQDIAITNITLDLIGEARSLYAYAAELKGESATEDTIAFTRDVKQYKNALLLEQPNTDWAYTIVRQFFYDAFHFQLLHVLQNSKDEKIAEIAQKSLKEVTYHLKWSSEWVIRLGDGTDISKEKMQMAINDLWEYTGEFFTPTEIETKAFELGIAAEVEALKPLWLDKVKAIIDQATLTIPSKNFQQNGGKNGLHTEHLGYILAEMQFMQRAYPGLEW